MTYDTVGWYIEITIKYFTSLSFYSLRLMTLPLFLYTFIYLSLAILFSHHNQNFTPLSFAFSLFSVSSFCLNILSMQSFGICRISHQFDICGRRIDRNFSLCTIDIYKRMENTDFVAGFDDENVLVYS